MHPKKTKFYIWTIPNKNVCGAFCPKIGLILVHTYPVKSTFLFNHTYEKVIGGLGKVLIHYYLWIETIIIPTHHYFGCNCSLPVFSRISHKKQSRTVLKIITVGWFMLQNKFWHVFSHKYSWNKLTHLKPKPLGLLVHMLHLVQNYFKWILAKIGYLLIFGAWGRK